MKRLLPILMLALLGCQTLSPNGAAFVQSVATDASAIATDATLKAKPEYRPAIRLTLTSLEAYKAQNSGDVIELNRILQGLPVVEHVPGGPIFVTSGISLLGTIRVRLASTKGYTNYSSFAQPIARGLIAGISQGIAANPP